ncbi:Uncharacterised protein (plasmid) [Tsukamurella tyrosinosolvens]|uniref:Uncharacterized protein n=1 Tax=Tsukamurella tyrosinosolvens TaxID=57704 RepID=A0A1H4UXM2_TSUTY|nr:hypothetical protein [Tsukamurella tyrosinosolvens]KXO98418.1 hypothetical protein AXK58_25430 [Tsukamurella tyrosinosolvens]SEC73569.1 hypothetical protein SAMN04489793_3075 [Tsukamurella tyrosinosolvens]VEH90811.1 Uncharacterised protein [Tsukamurella tyrosinosolvens]
MSTVQQARAFLAANGNELTSVGEYYAGWTVVASTYSWFKHSTVYFDIVAADPDGELWQYTVGSNYEYGTDTTGDPIPVLAEVETKRVVTYRPRLIPREA